MKNEQDFKPYKTDTVLGDYYQHPTFGIISINRTQGTSQPLFGSSILHMNQIQISISHAELCRGLNRDSIFSRNEIIRVVMSPTQFADAITGLNVGSGTPVTIKHIAQSSYQNLERVDPPFQSKVKQFNDEFKEDIENLGKEFDSVISLANETKAQKRLIHEIELLKMHFTKDVPFVNKQFTEQMEHTIKEAKGEVEAFVNHAVTSYGIEAIRQQAPKLPEVTEIKELEEGKSV